MQLRPAQFLVFALTFFLFPLAPVFGQVVSARAGVVRNFSGEVFYRCHTNKKNALLLSKNSSLHNKDTILTGTSGSALLSLNPDSYLFIGDDSYVEIEQTELDKMHFDIERGEIFLIIRSLNNGASLAIHTPPGILTIHKGGRYRVKVGPGGNTEANVLSGEIRYFDGRGDLVKIKKGRQVNFVKRKTSQE
ncbi:MAG: hypothetical protein DWQ47_11675 [Acidobacteria bacterium]|mgnify:CR=1 FL=1|nr:MAG: hypothetical protein DWQ32_14090 [Acidobacteriota bacterium]REJ98234.1 MAG: hypothetical protein DWQ38_16890 [Acidobacteriota bacterium]REK16978.1 MAG: hypothetical protein DWQ43_01935 [Acidobacteriota bacterium]REK42888.1 MAG: hypothetical protein DWQ47_11675 [Acidobacteriota bacterium]